MPILFWIGAAWLAFNATAAAGAVLMARARRRPQPGCEADCPLCALSLCRTPAPVEVTV